MWGDHEEDTWHMPRKFVRRVPRKFVRRMPNVESAFNSYNPFEPLESYIDCQSDSSGTPSPPRLLEWRTWETESNDAIHEKQSSAIHEKQSNAIHEKFTREGAESIPDKE